MALNLTSLDPRNLEWVAPRDKQIAELRELQKGFEAAKAKFFKKIEKKRENLIATHQREKDVFLNKEQANSPGAALLKKSGDRARQTLAFTSKASTYTSTPQACPVKQTPPFIYLCSDDDEPVFLEQRTALASSPTPALLRDSSKASKCSAETSKPRRGENVLPQSPHNLEEQQGARNATLNNTDVPTDPTECNTTLPPQRDVEMPDRDRPPAEAAQGKSRLISGFNSKLIFA
ncbi:hypothetical protein GGP41_005647 [Bipolaris sorokiniana]|uniref:Uncharacterized protein n=1 Tax=Cochliobolus sativus TaxID=45130 RepID=A0A8H6DVR6_COCSA|nr:hypothetical protein GGP41_005647 [Bipolaris sorokiniana]